MPVTTMPGAGAHAQVGPLARRAACGAPAARDRVADRRSWTAGTCAALAVDAQRRRASLPSVSRKRRERNVARRVAGLQRPRRRISVPLPAAPSGRRRPAPGGTSCRRTTRGARSARARGGVVGVRGAASPAGRARRRRRRRLAPCGLGARRRRRVAAQDDERDEQARRARPRRRRHARHAAGRPPGGAPRAAAERGAIGCSSTSERRSWRSLYSSTSSRASRPSASA